jgi:hypothetical protein
MPEYIPMMLTNIMGWWKKDAFYEAKLSVYRQSEALSTPTVGCSHATCMDRSRYLINF